MTAARVGFWCVLGAAALIFPSSAHAQTAGEAGSPESRGQKIAREVDRQRSGFGDSRAHLTMVLRTGGGGEKTREMTIRVLEHEDGEKTLIELESPRDLRGTTLLTFVYADRGDDQWLYLPALKRVKRIASGARSGSFMGSEFAYEDIAADGVDRFTHRYERADTLDGVDVFIVERRPLDEGSAYSRQLVWVDQAEYRPLQIDYFDQDGELFKTLTFAGYAIHDGQFWRPSEMVMVNHQSGRSTTLIWRDYAFGTGSDHAAFDPRSLGRVR